MISMPRSSIGLVLTIGFMLLLLISIAVPETVARDDGRPPRKLSFNRDIRPILADKCFKCHGPDARQRKAKLRLDNERDAKAPAGSGSAAIVPGKIDESELYARITSEDADERMPPPNSGKSLSAGRDRPCSRHGSRKGPRTKGTGHSRRRSGPPCRPSRIGAGAAIRSTSSSWPSSKRMGSSLRPRPLGRRCSSVSALDLVGLPPSIEEVDAFLADRRERCPREAGRAAARFAALRRALGADLARRRALCRFRRIRERQVAPGVLLPRLGHRRAQPRPAVQPVHHRADCRRPDPGRHRGADRRDGVPAQLDDQRRRGHRSRAVPDGGDVRPHGLRRQGRSWA